MHDEETLPRVYELRDSISRLIQSLTLKSATKPPFTNDGNGPFSLIGLETFDIGYKPVRLDAQAGGSRPGAVKCPPKPLAAKHISQHTRQE